MSSVSLSPHQLWDDYESWQQSQEEPLLSDYYQSHSLTRPFSYLIFDRDALRATSSPYNFDFSGSRMVGKYIENSIALMRHIELLTRDLSGIDDIIIHIGGYYRSVLNTRSDFIRSGKKVHVIEITPEQYNPSVDLKDILNQYTRDHFTLASAETFRTPLPTVHQRNSSHDCVVTEGFRPGNPQFEYFLSPIGPEEFNKDGRTVAIHKGVVGRGYFVMNKYESVLPTDNDLDFIEKFNMVLTQLIESLPASSKLYIVNDAVVSNDKKVGGVTNYFAVPCKLFDMYSVNYSDKVVFIENIYDGTTFVRSDRYSSTRGKFIKQRSRGVGYVSRSRSQSQSQSERTKKKRGRKKRNTGSGAGAQQATTTSRSRRNTGSGAGTETRSSSNTGSSTRAPARSRRNTGSSSRKASRSQQ